MVLTSRCNSVLRYIIIFGGVSLLVNLLVLQNFLAAFSEIHQSSKQFRHEVESVRKVDQHNKFENHQSTKRVITYRQQTKERISRRFQDLWDFKRDNNEKFLSQDVVDGVKNFIAGVKSKISSSSNNDQNGLEQVVHKKRRELIDMPALQSKRTTTPTTTTTSTSPTTTRTSTTTTTTTQQQQQQQKQQQQQQQQQQQPPLPYLSPRHVIAVFYVGRVGVVPQLRPFGA